jgi:hypothetical protein
LASAFLAQHCGSDFVEFSRNRGKAAARFGMRLVRWWCSARPSSSDSLAPAIVPKMAISSECISHSVSSPLLSCSVGVTAFGQTTSEPFAPGTKLGCVREGHPDESDVALGYCLSPKHRNVDARIPRCFGGRKVIQRWLSRPVTITTNTSWPEGIFRLPNATGSSGCGFLTLDQPYRVLHSDEDQGQLEKLELKRTRRIRLKHSA